MYNAHRQHIRCFVVAQEESNPIERMQPDASLGHATFKKKKRAENGQKKI